jgi:hypothetical protein
MAESEPTKNARRKNAVISEEKGIQRGLATRGSPMSEAKTSRQPPSKPTEAEEAEFLKMLLSIRSSKRK